MMKYLVTGCNNWSQVTISGHIGCQLSYLSIAIQGDKCNLGDAYDLDLPLQVMNSLAYAEMKKMNAAKLEMKRIEELKAEVRWCSLSSVH